MCVGGGQGWGGWGFVVGCLSGAQLDGCGAGCCWSEGFSGHLGLSPGRRSLEKFQTPSYEQLHGGESSLDLRGQRSDWSDWWKGRIQSNNHQLEFRMSEKSSSQFESLRTSPTCSSNFLFQRVNWTTLDFFFPPPSNFTTERRRRREQAQ